MRASSFSQRAVRWSWLSAQSMVSLQAPSSDASRLATWARRRLISFRCESWHECAPGLAGLIDSPQKSHSEFEAVIPCPRPRYLYFRYFDNPPATQLLAHAEERRDSRSRHRRCYLPAPRWRAAIRTRMPGALHSWLLLLGEGFADSTHPRSERIPVASRPGHVSLIATVAGVEWTVPAALTAAGAVFAGQLAQITLDAGAITEAIDLAAVCTVTLSDGESLIAALKLMVRVAE